MAPFQAACIPSYPTNAPIFLDSQLAAVTAKSGYNRSFQPGTPTGLRSDMPCYAYHATPVTVGQTGVRGFGADCSGIICYTNDGTGVPSVAGELPPVTLCDNPRVIAPTPAPGAPDHAVELRGIEKSFRVGHLRPSWRRALEPLTLSVSRGEILGYLGPNGSGKTTTLKILIGLLFPDAGTGTILGHPLGSREWRYRAGYLPEHPYFYDYLTAAEYLDYAGRLFGMTAARRRDRSREMLARVGLEESAHLPLRRYSKGMTQRVGLAQALLNDPELVLLDEPMSGLDPLGRRLVRRIILDLKEAGKTVLFSTHILGDAESLCDRVALLRGGRLLQVGALDEILTMDVSHLEVLVGGLAEAAVASLGVDRRLRVGDRWTLEVEERRLGEIVRAVEAAKGRILGVQPVRQSLEEYFVARMGAGKADAWD